MLWRKALPRSRKHKAPLVVQWSRPLLPVKRFLSGESLNLGRAEVGAMPTVLQSGDSDVIFTIHACFKDYGIMTLSHTALAHLR